MRRLKLGVMISGNGSNLQTLIDACENPDYPAEITIVVSNRPDAFGLERAESAGLPAIMVDHKTFDNRTDFEDTVHNILKDHGVQLVCLAGFMRLLGTDFVNRWKDRMINIHPSLLPSYKGLNTYVRALEDGVRFAGCTIHYVRPEMDNGPIIMQAAVPIAQDDTPETLATRIQGYEHKIYPEAVRYIATGAVRVSGNKVIFGDPTMIPSKGLISPKPSNLS